ncbi:serine protease [Natronococcus pandeyae]|uniref:Serine protease n=2 Tax=Natronococcus pandeyae TaxID=2055836 RepID=A0A8J8Q7C9_9EURY|nr:serine protease [Natronococcus pandeyae]
MLRATGAVGLVGTAGVASGNEGSGSDSEPYIVGTVDRGGRDEARRRADEVRHVLNFGGIGWAVAGEFSEEARENLQRRNDVRYVEEDGEMEAIGHSTDEDGGDPSEEQVLPWGIDRVDAEVAHHEGETGGGSSVAIIDTGIDPEHETLDVVDGKAFVSCIGLGCEEDWDDDQGHGTHCAGTANALDNDVGVVGVSTEADLYAVKVLDTLGSGSMSDVAAGIEWTADQGIDVGSLSLGGGDSETLEDACEYAQQEGTLLVAAAGNDGPDEDSVSYPAAYDECLAVSATTEDDDIASFSSRGEEVELAAPGADVLSSLPGDDYERWDGTSMACPHVSGAAAQLMEDGYTNEEAREQLNETAEDIGLAETEQGNGLLDVAAALGLESDDDNDDGDDDDDDDSDPVSDPDIDEFSVSTRTSGRWNRADVDWTVSDDDGALESVTSELLAADGTVLDEDSSSVDGSSASGEHELRSEEEPEEVRLTVVDEGGNETSETGAY